MARRELDPWIEGYLSYLKDVQRMHHRTITDIRCTLRKLSTTMDERSPSTPLWKLELDDFIGWLNDQRDQGRSNKTLQKEISHIRGLLDYAWRSGRSDRNVLDGFRLNDSGSRTPPRTLTLNEAAQLVSACKQETAAQRRNRLMLLLLYGCGLRTSELCGLDVQDVNVERGEILVKHGKGDVQRTIPVPTAVWTELLAYLTERGGRRGPLFRTHAKRKRIGAKDVRDAVNEAVTEAGISGKVTARTLRHAFGTHLMDRGVDLAVISSLMGHKSPTETGVYLHVLSGRTEEAVEKLNQEEED